MSSVICGTSICVSNSFAARRAVIRSSRCGSASEEIAALRRELIEPARIEIALRALGRDLVAELADRRDRELKVGSIALVTASRLNSVLASSVSSAGRRSPLLERDVDQLVQHLAGIDLADGEIVVARHQRRRRRARSRRDRSPGSSSPISIERLGRIVAAIVGEIEQQANDVLAQGRRQPRGHAEIDQRELDVDVGGCGAASRLRLVLDASERRRRGTLRRRADRTPSLPTASSGLSSRPAARRTRCPGADRRGSVRRS